MNQSADFSIPLFLILVGISAYLATARIISGGGLAACIVASAAAVILVRNVDRISELAFKGGDQEVAVKMRQFQQEIYAKVEELQRVATGLATFTAASIINENRYVGEDHGERMLRRRDELEKFLSEAGVPPEKRAEVVGPITEMVDWDMRMGIRGDAVAAFGLPSGTDPTDS